MQKPHGLTSSKVQSIINGTLEVQNSSSSLNGHIFYDILSQDIISAMASYHKETSFSWPPPPGGHHGNMISCKRTSLKICLQARGCHVLDIHLVCEITVPLQSDWGSYLIITFLITNTRKIYARGIWHMARTPGPPPPSFSTQKNRCPSEYAHGSLRSLIYIYIYIYITPWTYIYITKPTPLT